jgi:hypothetical protein
MSDANSTEAVLVVHVVVLDDSTSNQDFPRQNLASGSYSCLTLRPVLLMKYVRREHHPLQL